MERSKVYEAIETEREFQDRKWGTIEKHPHEVGGWITLMRKLLNDAEVQWSVSAHDYNAMEEIRKVIAVGVACCEQHGCKTRSKFVEPPLQSMRHPTYDSRRPVRRTHEAQAVANLPYTASLRNLPPGYL